MFDHVKFGVSDYAASKAFFLKALEPLGVAVVSEGRRRTVSSLAQRGSPGEIGSSVKPLPATIAKLQNLEELDLGRNHLETIPQEISNLKNLKKLGLDYNDLHDIPSFIGDL